jgi:hypothetical protein
MSLNLENVHCKMGKYSNNTEFAGGDETNFKRAWTVPFTGLLLTRDQFNVLAKDEYAERCMFEHKGDIYKTMPWLTTFKIVYQGKDFVAAFVVMKITDQLVLEFEKCNIKINQVVPQPQGGMIAVDLAVTIHPDDSQMKLIDNNQRHTIQLCLRDAVEQVKREAKQQEMPLQVNEAAEKLGEEALANGNSGGDGKLQAEAFLDTHVYWQNGDGSEHGNGKRRDMPDGFVEIDPPKGSESEAEQQAAGKASAPEDLKAFEKSAQGAVADFAERKKRGGGKRSSSSRSERH